MISKTQSNGGADNANRIIANRKYFVCSAIRALLIRPNKGGIFCKINLFCIYIILKFNAFTTVNFNADIEKLVYIIIGYFGPFRNSEILYKYVLRTRGVINVFGYVNVKYTMDCQWGCSVQFYVNMKGENVALKNAIFSVSTPKATKMTHWKLDVTWRCHRCSAVFTAASNGHAMRSRQISQKQMRTRFRDERDWWRVRRRFSGTLSNYFLFFTSPLHHQLNKSRLIRVLFNQVHCFPFRYRSSIKMKKYAARWKVFHETRQTGYQDQVYPKVGKYPFIPWIEKRSGDSYFSIQSTFF